MEEGTPPLTTKKKRAQWTAQQMENVVRMVERGILSQYIAAVRYNIPRKILHNHLRSGSTTRKLGCSTILTAEQEVGLVRRIIRLADFGMPLTSKMLRVQTFSFCKIKNIPNTFNDAKGTAGKKWLRLFLKRHLELARHKAQMMNPARAQKLNKDIVGDHFSKYKSVLDRRGIKHRPKTIYNIDEKNCRISLPHQQQVLTGKGKKRVHQIANEYVESVGCSNAIGSAIPPICVLFKGKGLRPKFQDNLLPGTLVKMTPKGSMTTETFIEFITHLNKFRISGPCLLTFDGAKCHLDYTIVDEADKCGITLYCLPSNTVHELQPMDKPVYGSFEHYWDQELIKYISQHPERTINKMSFTVIPSQVWPKRMTISNIMNGFRATGLYPYDPDAIPEEAFAPSALSELPNTTSSKNILVSSAESREEETPTVAFDDADSSGTATENLLLSLLLRNHPNTETHVKQMIKSKPNVIFIYSYQLQNSKLIRQPHARSLSITELKRREKIYLVISTSSPSQTNVPSSTSDAVPSTSSSIKTRANVPKSLAITGTTSAPVATASGHSKYSVSVATRSKPSKVRHRDNKTSWYYPSCIVDDMRKCLTCGVWYHELCDINFYCSGDCIKKKIKRPDNDST